MTLLNIIGFMSALIALMISLYLKHINADIRDYLNLYVITFVLCGFALGISFSTFLQ